MNISVQWLSDFVDHGLTPAALRDLLTARAATVDAVESVRSDLATLVVGRVVTAERHPDSDHLWVTTVDAGGPEPLSVVCGAPNVAVGGRYPFASVGTVMPNGMRIERRKIRGAISNGMLCSARELALGTDHEGILLLDTDAAPGTPLLEAMPIGDARLVIDVLPNRPDLLSHQGVAREVAAATGRPLREPVIPDEPSVAIAAPRPIERTGSTGDIRVTVEDPDDAPAYLGVVLRNVRVGPSPAWLSERLAAVGLRSISNVVDVTNYMLRGYGQPMHAFDLSKLSGREVRVRRAKEGERLRTLDGVDRTLDPSMVVIADDTRAQGIAGVIGGADSAVSESTTEIFLEIATFNPRRIRATRRALGISTDASYRFERLVPWSVPADTVAHAVRLLATIAAGPDGIAIAPSVLVAGPRPLPREVALLAPHVRRFLGIEISAAECARLLATVGFQAAVDRDDLLVTVPAFRTDVTREVDLVEEVARLYGYERIPDTLRGVRIGNAPDDPLFSTEARLRELLVGLGFLELRSMPFVVDGGRDAVRVLNPLAQSESHLRTSVLETLVQRAQYNLAQAGEGDLRLFEIGTTFSATGAAGEGGGRGGRPHEELRIAILAMGARRPPHFTEPTPPHWDAWDAKGIASQVAAMAFPGRSIDLRPAEGGATEGATPLWTIDVEGSSAGKVVRLAFDRPPWAAEPYGVELTLERVDSPDVAPPGQHAHGRPVRSAGAAPNAVQPRYRPIPAYPASWIDVTLLVPDTVPAGEVERVVAAAQDELLERMQLVSEYRGEGVPPETRSLTWRLTFRDSTRTLVEKQVEARRDKLLRALETELGVRPRTS